MEKTISQMLALQRQTEKLVKQLRKEKEPAFRAIVMAQLDQVLTAQGLPVPDRSVFEAPPMPAAAQRFWDVYEALESNSEAPVNHAAQKSGVIAIHLKDFVQKAALRKLSLPPMGELRQSLKESHPRRFIGIRPTYSAVNRLHNKSCKSGEYRPQYLKCWVFQKEQVPSLIPEASIRD